MPGLGKSGISRILARRSSADTGLAYLAWGWPERGWRFGRGQSSAGHARRPGLQNSVDSHDFERAVALRDFHDFRVDMVGVAARPLQIRSSPRRGLIVPPLLAGAPSRHLRLAANDVRRQPDRRRADRNLADTMCDTSTSTRQPMHPARRDPGSERHARRGHDQLQHHLDFEDDHAGDRRCRRSPTGDDQRLQPDRTPRSTRSAVGNNAVLKIVLDGINAGADADGLVIGPTTRSVRGLVIQRFDGSGVEITGTATSSPATASARTPPGPRRARTRSG